MPTSELLMYGTLAALAAAYYLYIKLPSLRPSLTVARPVEEPTEEGEREWKAAWVATLMRLQDELADEGRDCCVPLVRELIWRLMDGEPNDVPARAHAQKK